MSSQKRAGKGKQTKLVLEDKVVLLPGRHYCQCHAQTHGLVNNCLTCGRVVCEQEGVGPCFFCGNEVLLKGQRVEFADDDESFPEFADPNSDISKAIQHKNKMIEFDKSNFIQKNVFDEQTDWYSIADDVWQDKKARKTANAQIAARQQEIEENDQYIHVQYDTSQGKWIDNKPVFDDHAFKQRARQFQMNVKEGSDSEDSSDDEEKGQAVKASANKSLKVDQQNLYDEIVQELTLVRQASEAKKQSSAAAAKGEGRKGKQNKLQNEKGDVQKTIPSKLASIVQSDEFVEFQKEIQSIMKKEVQQNDAITFGEKGDSPYDEVLYDMQLDNEGKCLSMLQPWASLLIEGFKRFEGRFWTTDYRGPLYIHAGATVPTAQQIEEVENQYKEHYKGVKNVPAFPSRYPTGSLIGCVDLQGVLSKEDYILNVPEKVREDSQCDFIFVVRNPRKFFYPIKMKGAKNIFDIPDEIRINSKSQLINVPSLWFPWAAKDIDIESIQGNRDDVENDMEEEVIDEKIILEKSFPTLSNGGSKQISSEPKPILSKKRSNQKKDFMETVEIHSKLNNLASEIKVKMEGFGFMLAPFLSIDEQRSLADHFYAKSGNNYKIGMANLSNAVCDTSIPCLDKIIEYTTKAYCYFTEGKKSDCLNQIKTVEWCYLNPKQKRFAFPQDYFLIILLGADYEIVVQNNKTYQTKSVEVASATMLLQLFDENTSIIFDRYEPNTKANNLKQLGIKDILTNLVIAFRH